MKKFILISLMMSSSLVYAASPISQCTKILALSKDDFAAQISDPGQAASISETLNACAKQNACAEIDGIDDCASKLANRTFDSNFAAYANAAASTNNNSNNANVVAMPAPTDNNTVAAPTQPTNTSTYIAPLANPNAAPAPKQNINWF